MNIAIISAYITVSAPAAQVITQMMLIDIVAEKHNRISREG